MMPTITFQGETFECDEGDTVRDVLARNQAMPHKGATKRINCGGNSMCGTCAVRVLEGPVGNPSGRERVRLKAATHDNKESVRLACQFEITDDIVIEHA